MPPLDPAAVAPNGTTTASTTTGTDVTTPQGTTQAAAPPATGSESAPVAGAAVASDVAPDAVTSRNGKVVFSNAAQIEKFRREEREKGTRRANQALATKLGFKTIDELEAAIPGLIEKLKAPVAVAAAESVVAEPTPEPATGKKTPGPQQLKELETAKQELQKAAEERKRLQAQARRGEKRVKEFEEAAQRAEARAELKIEAIHAGVIDADYALHLLEKHVENMTIEDIEKFDENAFFKGLRETLPALFAERVVPATTGTGGSGRATPPKAPAATIQAATGDKVDLRKVDKQTFWKEIGDRLSIRRPTI